jgi:hypothetical protein
MQRGSVGTRTVPHTLDYLTQGVSGGMSGTPAYLVADPRGVHEGHREQ